MFSTLNLNKVEMDYLGIEEASAGDCVVCGIITNFIDKETGKHVCSEKCVELKDQMDGINQEEDMKGW